MTFGAGVTTVRVTVDPVPDKVPEPNESVLLTLTAGPGYTLGGNRAAMGWIINDDVARSPTPASSGSPPVPASSGSPTFQAASSGLNGLVTVAYMQPLTVAQPALSPVAGKPTLSGAGLGAIVTEAIALWTSAGLSSQAVDQLRHARFAVKDLPGGYLGCVQGNTIYLDRNAAGYGWFVDPTPSQSEEFSRVARGQMLRATDPRAVDRIDLLSVVAHELGHIAGLADLNPLAASVMGDTLDPGTRSTSSAASVDAAIEDWSRSGLLT